MAQSFDETHLARRLRRRLVPFKPTDSLAQQNHVNFPKIFIVLFVVLCALCVQIEVRRRRTASWENYSIIAALMTKPVFNISISHVDAGVSEKALLLMEVNESSLSYVIVDDQQSLLSAAYFVLTHLEGRNLAEGLKDIIEANEILHLPFREAVVVYNFPESTLVPDGVYHHEVNRDVMDLLFGNLKKGLVLSEKHPQMDVHSVYRVPAAVHSLMQQKFAAGKYWHIYTLWTSSIQSATVPEGQQMYLVFAADKVLVAIYRDNHLLLLQSFAYTTPEDVVYHLLHCCNQLALSQEECTLHISGFIDEDSALFNEIKKYFLKPEFDTVQAKVLEGPETEDAPPEYPPHYFSYLQKLALCV